MKIFVYNKSNNRYVGEISREVTHEREFGNYNAFEVSIDRKKYWGIGRDIYLPQVAIDYLKKKGEL